MHRKFCRQNLTSELARQGVSVKVVRVSVNKYVRPRAGRNKGGAIGFANALTHVCSAKNRSQCN
eukprot:scaffold32113_cov171-Skeletonema_menzelii.AAC.4